MYFGIVLSNVNSFYCRSDFRVVLYHCKFMHYSDCLPGLVLLIILKKLSFEMILMLFGTVELVYRLHFKDD